MNNLVKGALCALMAVSFSSCHIYQKYELPTDTPVAADFKKATEMKADSTQLPYLGWEKVFTDPKLQDLIRLAIANNKDLENARLNIDIAAAQLKGAKLSYLPSLAFTPNGGSASYGGSHMNWSYTLPLAASWEIDAFGKILNRKRGAEMAKEQMEDYRQAVQSQIVCGVASTYYAIVFLNQQLDLTKRTSEIWKEQVESMELLKNAGYTNEAGVVQSRANYYNIMSTIPDMENSIHELQNTLSLLLNTYPQTWEVTNSLDFDLPEEIVNGIPMSYLAVRPDVRASERALAGILRHQQRACRFLSEPDNLRPGWIHQSSRLNHHQSRKVVYPARRPADCPDFLTRTEHSHPRGVEGPADPGDEQLRVFGA